MMGCRAPGLALGVSGGKGGGVLLVGATTWGIDLARTLKEAGADPPPLDLVGYLPA